MKLKIALASATALGLMMGGALADDNLSNVNQSGDDNAALVTQSGSDNFAGDETTALRQAGHDNRLTIDQDGTGHTVGLTGDVNAWTGDLGVIQTSVNGVTNLRNALAITQTSATANGNSVGSVAQTASQSGRNTATITQGGDGNNAVNSVWQRQSSSQGNVTTITQEGSGNVIDRVRQNVRQGGLANPNEITVGMSGTGNGVLSNTLAGFALESGAETSTIQQGRAGPVNGLDPLANHGNKINLIVSGSGNQFGLTQLGAGNTVGTINLGGTNNQVGTYQDNPTSNAARGNVIALAAVGGDANDIGIRQVGEFNLATTSVVGDRNSTITRQQGNDNDAYVSITGSDNGGGLTFSGFADGVASGRLSGVVSQTGDLNEASLTVTTSFNAFTLEQDGDDNRIVSDIHGGDSNQLAVVQTGTGHVSITSQTGANNNIGVSQSN